MNNNNYKSIFGVLAMSMLSACGGGSGDSDGSDRDEVVGFEVGGTITGLNGQLELNISTGQKSIQTGDGSGHINWAFDNNISDSTTFTVSILAQPEGQFCQILSGAEGTTSGEHWYNVSIDCMTNVTSLTGVLLDSQVVNINYSTDSIEKGVTNENGEFDYLPGENITFYIADLKLPPTKGKSIVTPLDLAISETKVEQASLNIVSLLMSLDQDANPDNGIYITETARGYGIPINFDLNYTDFALQSAVQNLIINGGQDEVIDLLTSQEEAHQHINETLLEQGLAYNTSHFNGQRVYDVSVETEGESSGKTLATIMDFAADGNLNVSIGDDIISGSYQFSLLNSVIVVSYDVDSNAEDQHDEYYVIKANNPLLSYYTTCHIDDESVINAAHAYELCRNGIPQGSEVDSLMESFIAINESARDTLLTN